MVLRVASYPMSSDPFAVDKNLQRAETGVREAADAGADILVLPELFALGYCYDRRIHRFAEPRHGPTAKWMIATSHRFGIAVAGTVAERRGNQLVNTLLLATPDGEVFHYCKRSLPIFEWLYFRAGKKAGVLHTPLGRIGALICWDITCERSINQLAGNINWLLICSAWPDLSRGNHYLPWIGTVITRIKLEKPAAIARRLGVPAVVCNMSGKFRTRVPLTPFRYRTGFVRGSSGIFDAEGIRLVPHRANRVLVRDIETASGNLPWRRMAS